jgi:hypothetical protein
MYGVEVWLTYVYCDYSENVAYSFMVKSGHSLPWNCQKLSPQMITRGRQIRVYWKPVKVVEF